MQDLIIKNISQNENETTVYAEIPRKPQSCPCYGSQTDKVHDYRNQTIKDIPAFGKHMLIVIRKRRYVCTDFNKRFYEDISFLPRYHRDMWQQYTDVASAFFKNSTQIIDRYHFIHQMVRAFDRVRRRVQATYAKEYRLLFKHSKRILIKCQEKLKDWQKERVNALLYVSDELLHAYHLKERFYKMIDAEDRENAKTLMSDWIMSAQNSKIPEYNQCANTLINWRTGILNSFDIPYSNGFTEGCNNKIKVLKRNAYGYGYRNFERFRKRILHMFSHKNATV